MPKIYRNPLENIKSSLHISNKVEEKRGGSDSSFYCKPTTIFEQTSTKEQLQI